jgi:hypothetical protein
VAGVFFFNSCRSLDCYKATPSFGPEEIARMVAAYEAALLELDCD